MEKVRYMISDAANIVDVESHVLRYWEDELELAIPRNELGHRYYTKENIAEFQKIKELKEQGFQLRAIRMIIHNGTPERAVMDMAAQPTLSGERFESDAWLLSSPQTKQPVQMSESILDNTDRMAQFTELMTDIVGKALAANNEALSKAITEDVGEQVVKEMNYLMREREEAEEERFRQLDEAIRSALKKKETGRWGAKKQKKEKNKRL
jgi:DNA-binding transcriptional MerR regulator